jgi:hypothetical protein
MAVACAHGKAWHSIFNLAWHFQLSWHDLVEVLAYFWHVSTTPLGK